MNLLYPVIRRASLPTMLGYSVLGALLAGVYGIVHDQITYSISPEYFTRLKFQQFHWADFGFPRRVFVGEIGFLATWWVGFIAAWFLARITVPAFPPREAFRYTLRGFLIVFGFALAASAAGYLLGLQRVRNPDYSAWESFRWTHGGCRSRFVFMWLGDSLRIESGGRGGGTKTW